DAAGLLLGGSEAPSHAGSIVGDAHPALSIERDDPTVAAQPFFEVGNGLGGGLLWRDAGGDPVRCPLPQDELDDGLTPAGGGNGGAVIVAIAAATDERGIAHSSRRFVECATG